MEEARQVRALDDLATLDKLVRTFRSDTGRYPTTEEGLEALRTEPEGIGGWKGPYVSHSIPLDPWGSPYEYLSPHPRTGEGFRLWSHGSDSAEGGEGKGEDIVYEEEGG
jgi:general secretion pathway protein G